MAGNMKALRYTLVTDGSSDKALLPVLTWVLRAQHITCPIQPIWADLRHLARPLKNLAERVRWSLELYPCDLLFIHRDAEAAPREKRVTEIQRALRMIGTWHSELTMCVVPIRMTEAWLLLDEVALRRASGNPNGQQPLQLPPMIQLEQLPDPKRVLYQLLSEASGLGERRKKRFSVNTRTHRIAEFIGDFSPLRALSAFRALESDVATVVTAKGWQTW